MSREKQNKGDVGARGPIGCCPVCGASYPIVSWDSKTDTCTCVCGWTNSTDNARQTELLINASKSNNSEVISNKQSEWISVDKRLPEEAGRAYLVWDNVQATVKKRFFNRIPLNMPVETYPHIREYFGNVSDYKRYTHWMPLPEPPKGD